MANQPLIPPLTKKLECVLVYGPPGAGKGTLCQFLNASESLYHLSTGDIFRGLTPESPAGRLFFEYANKGKLLPNDATIEIWDYYVKGLIATNQFQPSSQYMLLDGIPRTVSQAEALKDFIDVKAIIVLEVDNTEALIARLQRRASIEGRADDKALDVLRTRMSVYENETLPILDYYPEHLIHRFNANQRRLEVVRDVLQTLAVTLTYE